MLEKQGEKVKKIHQNGRSVTDLNAEAQEYDSEDSWGGDSSVKEKKELQYRVNKSKKSPKSTVHLEREKRKR